MSDIKSGKMKAVRWEGQPYSVSVESVDIPKITNSLDAIVRITSSAICGSDLHVYRGRAPTTPPLTFGHENIGIVAEVGNDITTLKKGDRVVVTGILLKATDNGESALEGVLGLGGFAGFPQFDGGQAEFMRVPFANENLLIVPPGDSHELDYLLLADIWPTAVWALDCAGQVFGDTVVVFGAGPVGLLCVYSALLRGAARVYSVDNVPKRLAKAHKMGAIPINFSDVDPVAEILRREPGGVDRCVDLVGSEAIDSKGDSAPNIIINWAIGLTRFYGGIGLVGVYLPQDLKPTSPEESRGFLSIPIGDFFLKGLSMKGGAVDIRKYQEPLKALIEKRGAKPSFVFDKEYKIEEGAKAYHDFATHTIIKPVFRFKHSHETEKGVTNG
ncbi:S-(hydroxymethyl)glutathione dehydrogenase, partial [Lachnellula suecica]